MLTVFEREFCFFCFFFFYCVFYSHTLWFLLYTQIISEPEALLCANYDENNNSNVMS